MDRLFFGRCIDGLKSMPLMTRLLLASPHQLDGHSRPFGPLQRYRKFYDQNGRQHPFLESGMADEDAPNDLGVKPSPPTDSGSTVRAPRSDQATEGLPFSQHTIFKTIMAF